MTECRRDSLPFEAIFHVKWWRSFRARLTTEAGRVVRQADRKIGLLATQ